MKYRPTPPKKGALALKRPSEYVTPVRALITKNKNYLVNYHGHCVYADPQMNYLKSIVNSSKGQLPTQNEYGALRKRGLEEFVLNPKQEQAIFLILIELEKNQFYLLTNEEKNVVQNTRKAVIAGLVETAFAR